MRYNIGNHDGRFPNIASEQHRHDIADAAWVVIEPYTIGNKGSWGGNTRNTRKSINAVFWMLGLWLSELISRVARNHIFPWVRRSYTNVLGECIFSHPAELWTEPQKLDKFCTKHPFKKILRSKKLALPSNDNRWSISKRHDTVPGLAVRLGYFHEYDYPPRLRGDIP